ncbi:MAG TPA: PAS domain-containing protein, partial [Acidimicrobiia bacterium]
MIAVLLGIAVVAISGFAVAGWLQASRNRDRLRDVAEHLREETIRNGELATGRERFARAVDALDDGIIIVDEMGTIVARNRAAAKYVGARHAVAIAEDEISRVTSAALAGSSCTRE